MLANPVKAQDSWRVAVDEVRDELRRGPGSWKPTEVLGFALAPMRKIFKRGSNLVNFILQHNCSGWVMENELEGMGWEQSVLEREGSGLN